jgi:addiction module HigA family antidote
MATTAKTIAKTTAKVFEPDWVTHPGTTLLEVLESRQMTQKELARRTNLSTKHINQIILGKAAVTPETAILLERVTGVSAKFWNVREADYQTRKAKLKAREQLLKERGILKHPAVKKLLKQGELEKKTDPADQLEALLSLFHVGTIEQLYQFLDAPLQTR